MVYLPYSDDVRQPEADSSFTGLAHPQADKQQIEAAEKMMTALSLPVFASSDIPNPTLQRHYQVRHKSPLNLWLGNQPATCDKRQTFHDGKW